ncbi:hypothetical protein BH11BAC7_BH11BAC7_31310 [soil metagenome]
MKGIIALGDSGLGGTGLKALSKNANFNDMSTFVTVAIFTYAHEAAIPKARLESEGILCYLKDEHSLMLQPFFTFNGSGIKLQVNAEDAESAIRILEDSGYETEKDFQ